MSAGYAPFTRDDLEVGQDRNGVDIKVGDQVRCIIDRSDGRVAKIYRETNEVEFHWGQSGAKVAACEHVEVKRQAR
jgi:hypothetical protein